MKFVLTLILLINSIFLFAQELENDSIWIESESKLLFTEADRLTSIVYYDLELDYLIENIDTLTEKGLIKKEIYLEQKEYLLKRALSNYEELTTEYPLSSLYHKALNNRGTLEFEFKMYNRAKKSFLEILESDVNDKEDVRVGYGLMAEPYANYRIRASEMLYEIEFALGNYDAAKNHLNGSTKYQYHHWCGNAHEEKALWLNYQKSKIESKLENHKIAAKLITPYIFNRRIMKDPEFANYCLNQLLQIKTKKELISEFENGINNYYSRKIRPDSEYLHYFIKFLGEELEVDIRTQEEKEKEVNLIREEVENQWIYLLIKSDT